MIKRQQLEEKLKALRKQRIHTDSDLGQISILLWILEDWNWETEKAILESRLRLNSPINHRGGAV